METMLAVIPTNWTILSVSFSAGPMIHWMNSPEHKNEDFENIFSIQNTSLIGSLHRYCDDHEGDYNDNDDDDDDYFDKDEQIIDNINDNTMV